MAIVTFSCCGCNSEKQSVPPQFKDGQHAIDSLKTVYGFESVEYENWEASDAIDSALTVCFINSKNLPQASDGEKSIQALIAIAASIEQSVAMPEKYNAYHIIFVERTKEGDSHKMGMNVPVSSFRH